ncbi:hypothetical protein SLEP1_g32794 [Rubroshorea leprosula]|uniref:Uncharacterized protein n=1 Tax=Rubroshorea leprosula TaxID=152421 RepID=A0AAV5KEJ1_9ROSI|nr:hypothetical protein SLEP1_g32794 [Rubroshorea leprosula]
MRGQICSKMGGKAKPPQSTGGRWRSRGRVAEVCSKVGGKAKVPYVQACIEQETFLDDFLDYFLDPSQDKRELVAVTLCSIWNNRNSCIYRFSCSTPDKTIKAIKNYLAEYREAKERDADTVQELGQQFSSVESARVPPPEGTTKINMDAAIPNQ